MTIGDIEGSPLIMCSHWEYVVLILPWEKRAEKAGFLDINTPCETSCYELT